MWNTERMCHTPTLRTRFATQPCILDWRFQWRFTRLLDQHRMARPTRQEPEV
jgi:hypothetical protein